MSTESMPHVVYAKGFDGGPAWVLPNYATAHEMWKTLHTYQRPHVIATLGRVIDPSTPVIDPNE